VVSQSHRVLNPEITVTTMLTWNPVQMLERLGGDEKLLHEVVEIFLEEAPKHLAGLRRAIADRDAGPAERLAHSLQGELGYLGIAELSQAARDLEEKGRTADFQSASKLFPPFESAMARLFASMGDTRQAGGEEQQPSGSTGVGP
jgi:HPt (histidine-containing phosphotransfer) domain-containing protein